MNSLRHQFHISFFFFTPSLYLIQLRKRLGKTAQNNDAIGLWFQKHGSDAIRTSHCARRQILPRSNNKIFIQVSIFCPSTRPRGHPGALCYHANQFRLLYNPVPLINLNSDSFPLCSRCVPSYVVWDFHNLNNEGSHTVEHIIIWFGQQQGIILWIQVVENLEDSKEQYYQYRWQWILKLNLSANNLFKDWNFL